MQAPLRARADARIHGGAAPWEGRGWGAGVKVALGLKSVAVWHRDASWRERTGKMWAGRQKLYYFYNLYQERACYLFLKFLQQLWHATVQID